MIERVPLGMIETPNVKPLPAMVEAMRQGRFTALHGSVYLDKGTYRIIHGKRRIASAIKAGMTHVDVDVQTNPDAHKIAVSQLAENMVRSENVAQEFRAIMELINGGLKVKDIAAETGASQNTINKRLRLRKLIKPLFDLMEAQKISANTAIDAAPLPDHTQFQALDLYREHGRLTQQMVRGLRSARKEAALVALGDALEAPEIEMGAMQIAPVTYPHPQQHGPTQADIAAAIALANDRSEVSINRLVELVASWSLVMEPA
jgi:ParB/RepB/Spo0J family partition protein